MSSASRTWHRWVLLASMVFPLAGMVRAQSADQSPGDDPNQGWRADFRAATDDEAQVELLRSLEQSDDSTSVLRAGYLAVAHLLVSAQRRNVWAKWRSFSRWTSRLDALIEQHPNQPELRFLRVTVQSNAPRFLGYADALEEDCGAVSRALEAGIWTDDPEHEAFIDRITNEIEACRPQN
ncbi:MAG: hypothetical protein HKN29_10200 [Rhodothermales bacterium]|nr:hypothetical protein [Rhodothermales bacterium]